LGFFTATLLVVANMVGTGVFTTTGFLIRDIGSAPAVLIVWLVGGVLALCGSLAYGELIGALPRNGGEYQLLSRIYHPAVGFTAGWISLIVGFSAPIGAASLAFGRYTAAVFPMVSPVAAALCLVILLSSLHALNVVWGGWVQNIFTVIKIALIVLLVAGGLLWGDPGRVVSFSRQPVASAVLSPAFAVGLIFVSFAYSGWNGAAYIAGEVREPARTLPRSLLVGTAVVVLLFLGLNVAFLAAAPASELSGVVAVGHVAATHLFGQTGGRLLSAVIALALISSVSAMIMAGPRVYGTMGADYPRLSVLRIRSKQGGPAAAIAVQALAAMLMVVTATFEILLTYIGFTLAISSGLTVIGVMVLRWREPGLTRPYRVWGYPWTPLLFVALTVWMVAHTVCERPLTALFGGITLASGGGLYFCVRKNKFL
jgi:APA family basic amino acid/polyamine antiporter